MATDIQITPQAGMPPVTTTTSGTTNTSGSEQIVPSAASTAAQGGQQQAAQEVTNSQQALADAIGTSLNGQAAAAEAQAPLLEEQNKERTDFIKNRMPAITAAQSEVLKAEDDIKNHQFYDYWDKKSTGDRVVAKIAGALDAFGNGILGIPGNEVWDRIQKDIDRDFEQQKLKLHSKEQIAEWKKEGVKDLYTQLQTELGALDVKHAKAYEAAGLKAKAMAIRAGIPEKVAEQNVITAKANEEGANKKLEATQRYERHVTGKTEKTKSTSETSAKPGEQGQIFDANGNSMGPADKAAADKVNTELGVMRQAHDSLNRLKDLYNTPMTGDVSADAALVRDRHALQEEIKSQMPQIKGFTRLTSEDMKVFDAIVGGKLDALIATNSGKNLVNQAITRLEDTAHKTVKAHGVQPNANILKEGKAESKPTTLPPGAIPGVQKSTGKRGYKLNGVFHATE